MMSNFDQRTDCISFLYVPAAPQMPRIEFNGSHVNSENNLTALEDTEARIKCVSRMGNPPSFIKWFLGKWIYNHLNCFLSC